MEQSDSWKSNTCLAGQGCSRVSTPTAHYRVNKSIPRLYPEPDESTPFPDAVFLRSRKMLSFHLFLCISRNSRAKTQVSSIDPVSWTLLNHF